MGDRPRELERAVASITSQVGPAAQIVVVGNGVDPPPLDETLGLRLDENLGVCAGRNAGAAAATGDILFFLDDDAWCAGPDVARIVLDQFGVRPELSAVAMRITDAETGETMQRHVPRLGGRDPEQAGDVTAFLGGACAIRRTAFDEAGGYPPEFWYAMEETDLAWRLIDSGHDVHYMAAAEVYHPATQPARHGDAFRLTARNRVWLAHRRLPRLLTLVYLGIWGPGMLLRAPSRAARQQTWQGLRMGIATRTPRPIARMRWRTVARLTRLGRPPVV